MPEKKDIKEKVLYFLSKKLDYPLVVPRNVTLTLNYLCNQRCVMCQIKDHMFDKAHQITPFEVKKIIDEMAELKIPDLVLTGGEPFLYEGIFEIIDYAKSKGIKTIMMTNAFFEKEVAKKVVDARPDHLQISMDGSRPDIYDAIRGSAGAFNIVIDNIKRFVERRLSVALTTTITGGNFMDLVNIARLAQGLGTKRLALRPAHVSNADPLSRDFHNVPFWIAPDNIGIFEKVCNELKDFNERTNFLDFCPGIELLPKYFRNGCLPPDGSCYIGFTRLIISYNERGSYGVWMCRDMIGDIRKNTLREIWYGQQARKMRKAIKNCKEACLFPEIREPEMKNIGSLMRYIRESAVRE